MDSMQERRNLWQVIKDCTGTAADRRNQLLCVAWILVWALSFTGASRWLEWRAGADGPLEWLVAILPNLLAFGALFSYLRYLRRTDEMMRKLQLEGLAIGFGVSVIGTTGYQLFERVDAPPMATGDVAVMLMMAFVIGQVFAAWNQR